MIETLGKTVHLDPIWVQLFVRGAMIVVRSQDEKCSLFSAMHLIEKWKMGKQLRRGAKKMQAVTTLCRFQSVWHGGSIRCADYCCS